MIHRMNANKVAFLLSSQDDPRVLLRKLCHYKEGCLDIIFIKQIKQGLRICLAWPVIKGQVENPAFIVLPASQTLTMPESER